MSAVALLAEGVDRNKAGNSKVANKHVALLAEGVDRNWRLNVNITEAAASPSSRRAWIEITIAGSYTKVNSVALLAEGVDRNRLEIKYKRKFVGRPPHGGRG